MQPERHTYKGHRVELRRRLDDAPAREAGSGARPELLIDDQPVRYGQPPDGPYAPHDYAYDWDEDLIELVRRFIDYQDQAEAVGREVDSGEKA
jgi:hypothetical protein